MVRDENPIKESFHSEKGVKHIDRRRQFEQEYHSEWSKLSSKYGIAFDLYVLYYYYTEEYDRQVCTGFNEKTNEAIPVNSHEYKMINRYARELKSKLNKALKQHEIDPETSRSAEMEVSRYSHELLGMWVKEINEQIKV